MLCIILYCQLKYYLSIITDKKCHCSVGMTLFYFLIIYHCSLQSGEVFSIKFLFCSSSPPLVFSYSINGQPLSRNSSVKDLGILFTSNLSWSEHIKSIVSKGYQTLGLLRRAFPSTTPVRAKRLLFLSLVLPKLSYCSPIWRPNLVKDITVLEGVQRRATKLFSMIILWTTNLDCNLCVYCH